MNKTNFWNDAAKYGAIIGLVEIVFNLFEILVPSLFLSILSLAVFIVLIYIFTKRRATLYGGDEQGYSYGQCLKYIFWMMVFSGILMGAWLIISRNLLFKAQNELAINQVLMMIENYLDANQLTAYETMLRRTIFSPIWTVVTSVVWDVICGVFFGLFISAYTKRDFSFNSPSNTDSNQQN